MAICQFYILQSIKGSYASAVDESWKKYLDSDHFRVVTLDNIVPQIIDIVTEATKSDRINVTNSEIAW